jgi:hypothetical protein
MAPFRRGAGLLTGVAPSSLFAGVSALVLLASLASALGGSSGVPCLFRLAFHVHCPGCGLWRSLQALWTGNFLLAVRYHPLGPIVFGLCLLVLLAAIFRPEQVRSFDPRKHRTAAIALAAAMIGLWVFRLVDDASGRHIFLW